MKRILYFFIVAFVLSQAGGWTSVFASAPEQLIHDGALVGTFNSGGTIEEYQTLGNGWTGTFTTIYMWVKRVNGSIASNTQLWSCPTSSYVLANCTKVFDVNATPPNNTSGGSRVAYVSSTPVSFDSTKYYVIHYQHANGLSNTVTMYGASSDVFPQGSATVSPGTGWGTGTPGTITTVSDFYFQFGAVGTDLTSDSYIFPNLPAVNQNTGSTTVSYSADYLYKANSSQYPLLYTPTKVMVRFTRLDVQAPTETRYCAIVVNAVTTCSGSLTLVSGGRYSVGWAMVDDSGNLALIADPYQFGVVSSTDLPPLFTPPQPDFSTKCSAYTYGMNYLCEMVVWFFYPSDDSISQWKSITLRQTFPFSYIYDVGNLYNELFANGGSMEYKVEVNTGALGTITFISASQIASVPYASTIKTILGYLIYFFTGMFLYRLIHKAHD